jgi:hypothetical protein
MNEKEDAVDAAPVSTNEEEPVPDAPDAGFTTAELLANAALAVVVLVAIWGLFREFGIEFIAWMRTRLGM